MTRRLSAVACVLMLGAACDERAASEPVALRDVNINDPILQGPGLVVQGPGLVVQGPGLVVQGPGLVVQGPGLVVQGTGLVVQGPGLVVQGVDFNGPGLVVQGPGLVVQGMDLSGSLLTGSVTVDGQTIPVSGYDFEGAEFNLRLEAVVDGVHMVENLVLRIDDIEQSEAHDDVYLYDLSYRSANSQEWLPYCGSADVPAVPLKGYWDSETGDRIDDPSVITFGCSNAVLAKCAIWGYRPWATATRCPKPDKDYNDKQKAKKCETISLQDHHQACTRMARADYCGDGKPATVAGTLIDIWDTLAPPIQSQFTDWPIEAEWTPDGAACVNFVRHPELGMPACFLDKKGNLKKDKDCGSNKKQRSELINAFDPLQSPQ